MRDFERRFSPIDPGVSDERERQRRDRHAKNHEIELESRWKRLVANSLGRRYEDATLGGYRVEHASQRSVVDRVCDYANDLETNVKEGRGIVLLGPPGTGKDHLAIGVLRRAVGSGLKCEAVDGQSLFQMARDAIGSDTSEQSLLRPYLTADMLLLSDPLPPLASNGGPKDYQLTILWRVIDGRYRNLRPTLVTANVANGAELEERLSPNIVDRLKDGSLVLPCMWPSYRKKDPRSDQTPQKEQPHDNPR